MLSIVLEVERLMSPVVNTNMWGHLGKGGTDASWKCNDCACLGLWGSTGRSVRYRTAGNQVELEKTVLSMGRYHLRTLFFFFITPIFKCFKTLIFQTVLIGWGLRAQQ